MNTINKRVIEHIFSVYRPWILLVVNVLILAFSINQFFIPTISDIQTLREDISVLQDSVNEKSSYSSYLGSLANAKLPEEQEIVHYALPSTNDIISIIVSYEGFNRLPGITLDPFDIRPGIINASQGSPSLSSGVQVQEAVSETSFDLRVTADNFDRVIDFVNAVHNNRRAMNIKRLSWETISDQQIRMSVSLVTYYYNRGDVKSSSALVLKGKDQQAFIDQLENTVVYGNYILDSVPVGKRNLMEFGGN
jgi:hypothetical protein